MCARGMGNMRYYNNSSHALEPLDETPEDGGEDWFFDSIMVFEGDYTQPASRRELIDVVLGLYAMVLHTRTDKPHSKKLYDMITAAYHRVFPPGLFEDMPLMLYELMDGDQELRRFVDKHTRARRNRHDWNTLRSKTVALRRVTSDGALGSFKGARPRTTAASPPRNRHTGSDRALAYTVNVARYGAKWSRPSRAGSKSRVTPEGGVEDQPPS